MMTDIVRAGWGYGPWWIAIVIGFLALVILMVAAAGRGGGGFFWGRRRPRGGHR